MKFCLDKRYYNLIGEIDEESVDECIRFLQACIFRSSKPITLYINSFGGSIYDGLALYDALEELREAGIEIITIASGKIMSMAFILYLAGSRRRASKRAKFLNHKGETFLEGNDESIELEAKEIKSIEKVCNEIIVDRTNPHAKRTRKIGWWAGQARKGNQYYDKDKAIELGIVNEY